MHRDPQLVLSIILFNVTLFSSEGSETKTVDIASTVFFVFSGVEDVAPYNHALR